MLPESLREGTRGFLSAKFEGVDGLGGRKKEPLSGLLRTGSAATRGTAAGDVDWHGARAGRLGSKKEEAAERVRSVVVVEYERGNVEVVRCLE